MHGYPPGQLYGSNDLAMAQEKLAVPSAEPRPRAEPRAPGLVRSSASAQPAGVPPWPEPSLTPWNSLHGSRQGDGKAKFGLLQLPQAGRGGVLGLLCRHAAGRRGGQQMQGGATGPGRRGTATKGRRLKRRQRWPVLLLLLGGLGDKEGRRLQRRLRRPAVQGRGVGRVFHDRAVQGTLLLRTLCTQHSGHSATT